VDDTAPYGGVTSSEPHGTSGDVDADGEIVDLLTHLRRRLRFWVVLGWLGGSA
jgi:hypothetical protein